MGCHIMEIQGCINMMLGKSTAPQAKARRDSVRKSVFNLTTNYITTD